MSNSFTNSNSAHKFKWISWTQCKFKVQITLIIFRKLWKGCQLPSTYPPLPTLYLHTVYACVCVCASVSPKTLEDNFAHLPPGCTGKRIWLYSLSHGPKTSATECWVVAAPSPHPPPNRSLQKLLPWKRGRRVDKFHSFGYRRSE